MVLDVTYASAPLHSLIKTGVVHFIQFFMILGYFMISILMTKIITVWKMLLLQVGECILCEGSSRIPSFLNGLYLELCGVLHRTLSLPEEKTK